MRFSDRVYKLCKGIPRGRITTYKIIAEKLDSQAYRAVGQALRNNPHPINVPCHRVVKSDGSLGGYAGKTNSRKKRDLLEKEGFNIKRNRIVDFNSRLYHF